MKEMINESKRRGKKLEWLIYALALISFALMILVIINNHETSVKSIEVDNKTSTQITISKQAQENREPENSLVQKNDKDEETKSEQSNKSQDTKEEINNLNKEEENNKTISNESINNQSMTKKEPIKENEKQKNIVSKQNIQESTPSKQTITPEKLKKESDLATKKTTRKNPMKIEKTEKQPSTPSKTQIKTVHIKTKRVKSYNWRTLKRYKSNPNQKLKVTLKYKVKAGDALWRIAKQFKVKTINIIAVNKRVKNPDKIFPGQVLLIPNK